MVRAKWHTRTIDCGRGVFWVSRAANRAPNKKVAESFEKRGYCYGWKKIKALRVKFVVVWETRDFPATRIDEVKNLAFGNGARFAEKLFQVWVVVG